VRGTTQYNVEPAEAPEEGTMASGTYRASKNRDQEREAWCVTFRHPLRPDQEGRATRVRRGLGTGDEAEADRLVDQLNQLLADETYWPLSARERAEHELDLRVVKIFYDDIEAKSADPWRQRDELIPLPGQDEGYSRILVVGATGAGKTTLLRQFIGTGSRNERFPSTSTAKTTIFDTEIVVQEDGPFRAAVSFLPKDRVRSYVEECLSAAVSAAVSGLGEQTVLRRLLEHHDQRFRLAYLLGSLAAPRPRDDGHLESDDLSDDVVPDPEEDGEWDGEAVEVDDERRSRFQEKLRHFLARTLAVAEDVGPSVASALNLDPRKLKPEDRDAFLVLVEEAVAERPIARALVDEIVSEIEARFGFLVEGELDKDRAGWPTAWTFETADRGRFIKNINRFSSNYAPNFGTLLAPVVQGLRVAGPFRTDWAGNGKARFVFIDGEGLGHTPASASTLPTSVTRRYDFVDVILLVDNATQPIQAAAQAVLRSVVAGGHDAKLAIAFTHFDQVVGDNLPDVHARKGHVMASLESSLRAVEDAIGSGAGRRLARRLDGRVFFVSKIQNEVTPQNRLTRDSLHRLLELFQRATIKAEVLEATPVYDLANLVLAVERATEQFHESWNARLGVAFKPGVAAEHWSRVKALTRRFAYQWEDQYDSLRPVADLIKLVSERLAAFLATPRGWEPTDCGDAAKEAAVDRVSREVYARLHKLVENRLFHDHVADWLTAYAHRGPGSTRPRAQGIRNIYEAAAPIPAEVPGAASTELLDVFRGLFREAADAADAKIVA
jgi:hypothetical protein